MCEHSLPQFEFESPFNSRQFSLVVFGKSTAIEKKYENEAKVPCMQEMQFQPWLLGQQQKRIHLFDFKKFSRKIIETREIRHIGLASEFTWTIDDCSMREQSSSELNIDFNVVPICHKLHFSYFKLWFIDVINRSNRINQIWHWTPVEGRPFSKSARTDFVAAGSEKLLVWFEKCIRRRLQTGNGAESRKMPLKTLNGSQLFRLADFAHSVMVS